jgi:type I restriction enzyme S subunit
MKVDVLTKTLDLVAESAVAKGGLKLFPKSSVLMVVRSGILKHTLPVAICNTEVTVNQDMKVFEPSPYIDQKYLFYLFRAFEGSILERCSKTGTTVNSVDISEIKKFPFPLPPLTEQKQIAAKLDELLAQVDSIKARLDAIPAILKRFRQSVLAAAVSGRLTGDWRKVHEANAGWVRSAIGALCLTAFDGPFGSKLKTADYTSEGVRVARLENIGHLNFIEEKKTYISAEKYQELIGNSLQADDVLFSSFVDEEIRVCLFPAHESAFINKADCFCLRFNNEVCHPKFAVFSLASLTTYSRIKSQVHGATRPHVNLRFLKSFEIDLPSMEEQHQIITKVQELFDLVNTVEAMLCVAHKKVAALTQSILAKAFTGDLTADWRAQNPDLITGENSAEALLKRIQAQRAAQPKGTRKKHAGKNKGAAT